MKSESKTSPCGQAPSPELCPLCGGPNACRMCDIGTHKGSCWCERVEMPAELLAKVPEHSVRKTCICHACVAGFRRERRWTPRPAEGEAYFEPDGRMVFTAAYHLRRGYCCDSGCRHCPYDADGHPKESAI